MINHTQKSPKKKSGTRWMSAVSSRSKADQQKITSATGFEALTAEAFMKNQSRSPSAELHNNESDGNNDNSIRNLLHMCMCANAKMAYTKQQIMEAIREWSETAITISLRRECYIIYKGTNEIFITQFRRMRDFERDETSQTRNCQIRCSSSWQWQRYSKG